MGRIRADAFCHHMVRSLVGCLVAVGEGRRSPAWAGEVLAAASRDPAVRVVPAHGLTLEEVGYPPDDELAAQAEAAERADGERLLIVGALRAHGGSAHLGAGGWRDRSAGGRE